MIELKVKGLEAAKAAIAEIGVALAAKALAKAARKAFGPVLSTARSLVPVDTGLTRDNIKIIVVKGGPGDTVVRVGLKIGNKVTRRAAKRVAKVAGKRGHVASLDALRPPGRRWHFIELGTSRSAAHPFLRPALDQNQTLVTAMLAGEIVRELNEALLKKRAAPGGA